MRGPDDIIVTIRRIGRCRHPKDDVLRRMAEDGLTLREDCGQCGATRFTVRSLRGRWKRGTWERPWLVRDLLTAAKERCR
jgi:hypothetical protein